MILYHGTSKVNAELIKKEGFSESKEGTNGSHFGDGVYLATTKKRAKAYGTHIVTVEVDMTNIFEIESNWLKDYQTKCQQAYDRGIPCNEVNTVVGQWYKHYYYSKGYTGIMMHGIFGTAKEIVVYDKSIIKEIS